MADTHRHELKYWIAARDVPALSARLEGALTRDAHAGERGEYAVRSLYFDDAFNSAYTDKLAGVAARDKYRVRVYDGDDSAIFLERKRKMGDLIGKSAVKITRRLLSRLIDGDPAGLEKLNNALIKDTFREMRLRLLRPAVIVEYDREAFCHPAEHVRITIDKNVCSGLSNLDLFDKDLLCVPAIETGRAVLEVKYDRYLPDFIAPLLSGVPAERSAVSKYVLCRRFAL